MLECLWWVVLYVRQRLFLWRPRVPDHGGGVCTVRHVAGLNESCLARNIYQTRYQVRVSLANTSQKGILRFLGGWAWHQLGAHFS